MLERLLVVLLIYSDLIFAYLRHLLRFIKQNDPSLDQSLDPRSIRSVLLFGYMGMGDAMMFQPALTEVLRRFPDSQIDVVSSTGSQSVEILKAVLHTEGREFRQIVSVNFKSLSSKELLSKRPLAEM
jgi:hypothetical protein